MKYWSPTVCLFAIPTAYFTMPHSKISYTCTLQTDTDPMYRTEHTVCGTYHMIKHDKYKYCKYSSKFWNISFYECFFMYQLLFFSGCFLLQCTCSVTPFLAAKTSFLDVLNIFSSFSTSSDCLQTPICYNFYFLFKKCFTVFILSLLQFSLSRLS
jgi:hypothetical protein